MRRQFIIFSVLACIALSIASYIDIRWAYLYLVIGPIVIMGTIDILDKKHTIIRNYPIVGRFRYIMEELRPKIYQYFIESDTDGTPINRLLRSVVYQRAKKDLDTTPFGTQSDVYADGYEWINHSMYPLPSNAVDINSLRVTIGGKNAKRPYSLSIFNISAMSFGALSKNAIEALNWGAKVGKFAHNTGEGGLSPYHLKHGGDIIWQIGTGYFGCRDSNGKFSPELFKESAAHESVKMIEIKLSQGAKPGHGGILPAAKNTPEIASIRGVKPWTTVESPGKHTAFSTPVGLLEFVASLRELSGGKPVGFKLCMGNISEFEDIIQAMVKTKITPDWITIDGGEGGTGAAPLEFSNYVGMSMRDGLMTAHDLLIKYNLRQDVKLLCAGKILNGFDIIRFISLGADACYSARGMMLALGCIQALVCNKNICPTGVATQDPQLYGGLSVEHKHQRIANFHHGTVESVAEILAAAGLTSTSQLDRSRIWRRISFNNIKNYAQLFPYPAPGLNKAS